MIGEECSPFYLCFNIWGGSTASIYSLRDHLGTEGLNEDWSMEFTTQVESRRFFLVGVADRRGQAWDELVLHDNEGWWSDTIIKLVKGKGITLISGKQCFQCLYTLALRNSFLFIESVRTHFATSFKKGFYRNLHCCICFILICTRFATSEMKKCTETPWRW